MSRLNTEGSSEEAEKGECETPTRSTASTMRHSRQNKNTLKKQRKGKILSGATSSEYTQKKERKIRGIERTMLLWQSQSVLRENIEEMRRDKKIKIKKRLRWTSAK